MTQSLQVYKTILDKCLIAIFFAKPDGRILYANQSACDLFNYTESEIIKLGRQGIIYHDEKEVPRMLSERKKDGSIKGELIGIRKGGEKFDISFSSVIFQEENGEDFSATTMLDITENKKTVQTLLDRNSFIEHVLQNLPIGISVNKIDTGEVTYLNKNFTNIFGWHAEEINSVNKFFQKIYPDKELRSTNYAKMQEAISTGDLTKMYWKDIPVSTKSGELKKVDTAHIPLPQQNLMISTAADVTEYFNVLNKFKKNKINQQALINGSEDLIWSVDKNLNLISANNSYLNIIQSISGKLPKEGDYVMIEEFGEALNIQWKNYYESALQGQRIYMKETFKNEATGKNEYALVSINPMTDEAGRIFGVACYSKDITDDTLNLQALEETKADLNNFLDSSPDVICTINVEGFFVRINKASINLWGYNPNELEGKQFRDFVHSPDLEKSEMAVKELMTGKKLSNFQNRYIHKNGFLVPVIWSVILNENDNLFYCTAQDATERIKSEESLINSEKNYRNLFESNPNPLIIWDFETLQIIDCNVKAPLKYGYTKEEFLKLNIKDLRREIDVPELVDYVKSSTGSGEISSKIWTHQKKTGELMYMDVSGYSIEYNGRKASLVTINDVTEKLRAEEELKKADEKYLILKEQDLKEKQELQDLLNKANSLAKIGSWEYDIEKDSYYWSDITKQIHEVNVDYLPSIEKVVAFVKEGIDRNLIKIKIEEAIQFGKSWDEEIRIVTFKGQERWVRIIGEVSFVNGKSVKLYGSFQEIDVQKRSEIAVLDAFEEKNTILESIGDGFFAVDKNWTITYWNKQAQKESGTKKSIIVGQNLWDIFPFGKETLAYEKYNEAMHTRRSVNFEDFNPDLQMWFEINIYPAPKGLSIYFRQITERKQAEQTLRESEEKRRLIMNAALDAIVCIDELGYVTFWNKQSELIFGWNENEMMGKLLMEYIIPDKYKKRHSDGMVNYRQTGHGPALNKLLEFTALRKNGEEFPIELTVLPINQNDDAFFCAFIRDITFRKESEKAIRLSNEQYNLVAKATNDSIWDLDIDTGIVKRNGNGFETLFGYKLSEHNTDMSFWESLIHPEDVGRVMAEQLKVYNIPNLYYWEDNYRLKKADGKYAFVNDKGYIVRDGSGKATRMIGATQDITKIKQHEIQLIQLNSQLEKRAKELADSNAELEQFAYVSSHDLQEPLRMVTGFLTQLNKKYGNVLDENGKKYIHFAVDGAKRMRQIILDLLEFSRVGRMNDVIEPINLNQIITEIKILYSATISEKHAVIEKDNLPTIFAHRSPVLQVFQNIIGNALKYTLEGKPPVIKVSYLSESTYHHFAVADNGIGIDAEYFDKIFIIFQRLHNKDEFSGTGIGLAITKKIIEKLGGDIWVESQEGEGSIFHFTIPVQIPTGTDILYNLIE